MANKKRLNCNLIPAQRSSPILFILRTRVVAIESQSYPNLAFGYVIIQIKGWLNKIIKLN